MSAIGIMQGRLLPPVNGQLQAFPNDWHRELDLCQQNGIGHMEWIWDGDNHLNPNPLSSFAGAMDISEIFRPSIDSLCADFFVRSPLLRIPDRIRQQRIQRLRWLICQCSLAGIPVLVIPFVDDNAIYNQIEADDVVGLMYAVRELVEACRIEIALETNLCPSDFEYLLENCPPAVGVNYDSGNSASLGYNAKEEWNTYGNRIINVHIKDRILLPRGDSVPLGEGNANFNTLAKILSKFDYDGNLILQVARGESGREIEWYHKNVDFLFDRGIG